MDIVVHGTKGGRQIFTPKKLGGLLDVNSDTSKASSIGQEVFAIRFIGNTIIFSKYKIIRDVRGDKRTGFLAFSLFLPNNKKLQGIDIISVLNEVSVEYCKRYIPENDNNLKDVREDWAFLDRISEKYKTMLRPVSSEDIENVVSGTRDDAFIYYEDEQKLQKYFDAPFQVEYSPYRQVLFIKEGLKEKPENPLNALRHSSEENLSGKIDLENPKYRLIFKQVTKEGVRIEVKVNNVTRSSNSKIRRKDELVISWSKQFCTTVTKKGNWNEISNEFIDVNDIAGSVSIREIIPPDETKTITFTIKDWKGNPVNGANIICKTAGNENQEISNNQITFKGEDLGKRWFVSASNGRFYSKEEPINFVKHCPSDTGNIDICLDIHKLKLFAHEGSLNNDPLPNVDISPEYFSGSEIGDKHNIKISCKGYENFFFDYLPADYNGQWPIHITLPKRKNNETKYGLDYTAKVGEHGTWYDGSSTDRFTRDKDGKSLEKSIKPNNRYAFTGFELQNDNKTIIAQYKKKKVVDILLRPKFIAVSIVGLIVFGFIILQSVYFFRNRPSDMPQEPTIEHIKAYIDGNSLILDTLKEYKNNTIIEENKLSDKLDSAIKKREFINDFNIPEIKKFEYSKAQNIFKSAIDKIDSTQYDDVKSRLGNISSWGLGQIADSINAFINHAKPSAENKPGKKEDVEEEKKEDKEEKTVKEDNKKKGKNEETQQAKPDQKNEDPEKEIKQPANNQQKVDKKQDPLPANTDNKLNVASKLQSATVTKEELQSWKTAGMDKNKKSIDLYLKFWSIIGSDQKDEFVNLRKKLPEDPILKNSELMNFLNSILANPDAFNKFKGIAGKGTRYRTIAELKSKM